LALAGPQTQNPRCLVSPRTARWLCYARFLLWNSHNAWPATK